MLEVPVRILVASEGFCNGCTNHHQLEHLLKKWMADVVNDFDSSTNSNERNIRVKNTQLQGNNEKH